ncbi:MAG: hypothetical protein WAZ19_12270 [Anaerolineae bacterium]
MNVAQWRKSNTRTIVLPSGLDVRIKKLEVVDVLSSAGLSSAMIEQFKELTDAGGGVVDISNLSIVRELYEATAKLVFVDPPIHPVTSDQGVALVDLSFADLQVVFMEVSGKGTQRFQAE